MTFGVVVRPILDEYVGESPVRGDLRSVCERWHDPEDKRGSAAQVMVGIRFTAADVILGEIKILAGRDLLACDREIAGPAVGIPHCTSAGTGTGKEA